MIASKAQFRALRSRRKAQLKLFQRTTSTVLGGIEKGLHYGCWHTIRSFADQVERTEEVAETLARLVVALGDSVELRRELFRSNSFRSMVYTYIDLYVELAEQREKLTQDDSLDEKFDQIRREEGATTDKAKLARLAASRWQQLLALGLLDSLKAQSLSLLDLDAALHSAVGLQWLREGERLHITGE